MMCNSSVKARVWHSSGKHLTSFNITATSSRNSNTPQRPRPRPRKHWVCPRCRRLHRLPSSRHCRTSPPHRLRGALRRHPQRHALRSPSAISPRHIGHTSRPLPDLPRERQQASRHRDSNRNPHGNPEPRRHLNRVRVRDLVRVARESGLSDFHGAERRWIRRR